MVYACPHCDNCFTRKTGMHDLKASCSSQGPEFTVLSTDSISSTIYNQNGLIEVTRLVHDDMWYMGEC